MTLRAVDTRRTKGWGNYGIIIVNHEKEIIVRVPITSFTDRFQAFDFAEMLARQINTYPELHSQLKQAPHP